MKTEMLVQIIETQDQTIELLQKQILSMKLQHSQVIELYDNKILQLRTIIENLEIEGAEMAGELYFTEKENPSPSNGGYEKGLIDLFKDSIKHMIINLEGGDHGTKKVRHFSQVRCPHHARPKTANY